METPVKTDEIFQENTGGKFLGISFGEFSNFFSLFQIIKNPLCTNIDGYSKKI